MPKKRKRLWEVDHPYYCAESNYFASTKQQPEECYDSWQAFISERGDYDKDQNLVFRFDWKEGDDHDLPNYNGDKSARIAKLVIYYVLQRKGIFAWAIIDVCRNDEPAVYEWLKGSYAKIQELWKPFS
jgi:hypothetical protein